MIFVIGDRVGLADREIHYNEHGDDPEYGVVTDTLSDGRLMVEWDNAWMNKRSNWSKPIHSRHLLPDFELRAKYSELEQAFHKVETEVREKMTVASQSILDAQEIAKTAGFNLQELSGAVSPLERAMEKAGWNTSSWYC